MIKKPESLTELRELESANNVIVKINSGSKLNGIYPAYKKVAKWVGHKDEWDVFFIASKQYHTLLDMKLRADVNYDWMMGKIKDGYSDSFERAVKVFKTENEALQYLS